MDRVETPTEQLQAERDYLLKWLRGELVGASACCMVGYAFGDGEPGDFWWPSDRGDLGRCQRAFDQAPAHLKERMEPLLKSYRENLACR